MSRLGLIKGLLRNTGVSLSNPINPLTAFYGGEIFAAPLARSLGEDLGVLDPVVDPEQEFKKQQDIQTAQFASLLKKRRLQEQGQKNMEILRTKAPDVYQSVMAGRRLPQGAVVLGGRPRQDLLQELAQNMGSLPEQDPFSNPF